MTLHQKIKQQIVAEEGVSAQMEVPNTFGRADIVTSREVVEVSNINGYKEAFGRVLAYTGSPTFAGRGLTPRLHLFCDEAMTIPTFEKNILQVFELCKGRVRLTFGNNGTFTKYESPFTTATTSITVPATPPVISVPQMQRQPSIQSVNKKFDRFKN